MFLLSFILIYIFVEKNLNKILQYIFMIFFDVCCIYRYIISKNQNYYYFLIKLSNIKIKIKICMKEFLFFFVLLFVVFQIELLNN